eukprot:scaffold439_cov88-Cylindrotheca_fusiformis.AAC.5
MNSEIRRLLLIDSQQSDDGSLGDPDDTASFWIQLVLLGVCGTSILFASTMWYLKRRRLRQSGHHKKVDE